PSSARARARPAVPVHADDRDTSRDRLPGSATGVGGGANALNEGGSVCAAGYSRSGTGGGGTGGGGGDASGRPGGGVPPVPGGTVATRSSTVVGFSSG